MTGEEYWEQWKDLRVPRFDGIEKYRLSRIMAIGGKPICIATPINEGSRLRYSWGLNKWVEVTEMDKIPI